MKGKTQKAIKKMAEDRDSIKLYKVAMGETDLFSYLTDYIKENNLGETPVGGTTLIKVLNANAKRRKQLAKWVENEENDAYKALYSKEIKILDDYSEKVFIDVIGLEVEEKAAQRDYQTG